MKIYVSHASSYDYASELYEPLKNSFLDKYDVFFPHDAENIATKLKDILRDFDLVIAEVSYPSTGQGIELGWASTDNIPIVCINKIGSTPSNSLRFICSHFIEYDSVDDMVAKLSSYLTDF